MAEEDTEKDPEKDTEDQEKKRSNLTIVSEYVQSMAKGLTIYTGTIYVIGFLVTAARLARYGVTSTELLNSQYIAAGLLPGLLLWITILVLVSASRYEPRKTGNGWKASWRRANVAFVMPIWAVYLLSLIFGERFGEIWEGLYPEAVPLILLLGELGLWILIVGLKRRVFLGKSLRRGLGIDFSVVAQSIYVLLLLCSVLLLIAAATELALKLHKQLPQAYGGGKLLTVRLYVDGENVPVELLEPGHDPDQDALAWTIPLNLVFKTSEEFILVPLGIDESQTWILKASEVHTIASE
jgi:hypothetical protein